jgi:hypothetical protein
MESAPVEGWTVMGADRMETLCVQLVAVKVGSFGIVPDAF